MMTRSSTHHMRHRALLQDDGQFVILSLVVVSGIASLAAIAGELAVVKDLHGLVKIGHIWLAGITVLSSGLSFKSCLPFITRTTITWPKAKVDHLDCSFPETINLSTETFSISLLSSELPGKRRMCPS